MPKSKYSPWSSATELTLKQAPYQKLRSGYTMTKTNGSGRRLILTQKQCHLSQFQSHSRIIRNAALFADACIACMPLSWEAEWAHRR